MHTYNLALCGLYREISLIFLTFDVLKMATIDNRYCPLLTDVHFVTDLISKCLLSILTSRLEETVRY